MQRHLYTFLIGTVVLAGCQWGRGEPTQLLNDNSVDFDVPSVVLSRWYDGERWHYYGNFPIPHSCVALAVATSTTPTNPSTALISFTSELKESPCVPSEQNSQPLNFSVSGAESFSPEFTFNGRPLLAQVLTTQPTMIITSPQQESSVSSPLNISGEATGSWFFEATMPVEVRGENGETLGQGFVTAEGDWMTKSRVPFSGKLEFDTQGSQTISLIFRNANPSDNEGFRKEHRVNLRVDQGGNEMRVRVGENYSFQEVPFRVVRIQNNVVTIDRDGRQINVTSQPTRFGARFDIRVISIINDTALIVFSKR